MKKNLIVGILISTFLLGSCSVDLNDEKYKKIDELKKQVVDLKQKNENDLFKKKQVCASHEAEYVKYINKFDKDYVLVEIFYSPKLNTCIGGVYNKDYFIEDVLTKKEFRAKSGLFVWNKNEYDSKILELKGE